MLRTALLCFAVLLIAGGTVLSIAVHRAAGIGPIGSGIVLLLALLFERRRYKQIVDAVPGPDWEPTGERFIEPGADTPVAVYTQKATGHRIYVRIAAPAPPR